VFYFRLSRFGTVQTCLGSSTKAGRGWRVDPGGELSEKCQKFAAAQRSVRHRTEI